MTSWAHALFRPSRRALAYATTTVGASLLNGVFQALYVSVFLRCWRLSQWWFFWGQLTFMIWNAVNDPLFAWLQDRPGDTDARDNVRALSSAIYFGGPLFAASFLLPWWPLGGAEAGETATGLHFIVALCLFDGMFTYVVLAQCALFSEIEVTDHGRSRVLALNAVAGLVGSLGVAAAILLWTPCHLWAFRCLAVFLAALSGACFHYTGSVGRETRAAVKVEDVAELARRRAEWGDVDAPLQSHGMQRPTVRVFCQVARNPQFLRFVSVNFCQILNTTFNSSFLVMFAPHVLAGAFDPATARLLLGAGTVGACLLTGVLSPLVGALGSSYYVIRLLLFLKVAMAGAVGLAGAGPLLLGVYMAVEPSCSAACFSFFNLSISDLIDDDMTRHARTRRLGPTFFGLNALFTKPAQSVAPMAVVALLSSLGFQPGQLDEPAAAAAAAVNELGGGAPGGGETAMDSAPGVDAGDGVGAAAADGHNPTPTPAPVAAMRALVWAVPFVCGLLQLLVWRGFTLRGGQPRHARQEVLHRN